MCVCVCLFVYIILNKSLLCSICCHIIKEEFMHDHKIPRTVFTYLAVEGGMLQQCGKVCESEPEALMQSSYLASG